MSDAAPKRPDWLERLIASAASVPRYDHHDGPSCGLVVKGGPIAVGMDISFVAGSEESGDASAASKGDAELVKLAPVVRTADIRIRAGEPIVARVEVDTVGLELYLRGTLGTKTTRREACFLLVRMVRDALAGDLEDDQREAFLEALRSELDDHGREGVPS